MALALSAADLALLEQANRTLVSPLAASDTQAWRGEVLACFQRLLGVDRTLFALPLASGMDYYSPDMDAEDLDRFGAYIVETAPGVLGSTDRILDDWFATRRARRLGLYNDLHMDQATGMRYTHSDFYHDAVVGGRMFDHQGYSVDLPTGEALLCLSYADKGGARPAWDRLDVLRLLQPALTAGLETLCRLEAHRAALDVLREPLAAFTADGVEAHRNAALVRLLADEPHVARVEAELGYLVQSLQRFAFPRRLDAASAPPKVQRVVTTARARYHLQVTLLPTSVFTAGREALLVTVQAEQVQTALPSTEAVRKHFGLTRREAETALLVAQGLGNDEIAERLFVSRHTVRHHVEALMAKLDVTGRGREAVPARLLEVLS